MMKNIQKLTNSLNKKVDNLLTARLERVGNNLNNDNPPNMPASVADDPYNQHRGYYYQPPPPHPHHQQQQPPPPPPQHPPYNYAQPPPPPPPHGAPPAPPAPQLQDYYATPPQQHAYAPPPTSQPHASAPMPPQLPLPEPLKSPQAPHLPMAYAGYPDAAVEASTGSGTPILPPHANTPSPPTTAPTAPRNVDLSMLTPPPEQAGIEEKVAFIMRISTVATVAVCGDLGVQPWFCALRRDADNMGGVSEEFHVDEQSLLLANFGSIGLPTGSAAQLVDVFTTRNNAIFEGYRCEIRPGTPAVLVERFGNFHQMVDVYYRQAVEFANTASQFGAENHQHELMQDVMHREAGGQTEAPLPSLKFASPKDGGFQHVVDTVRRVKRVS